MRGNDRVEVGAPQWHAAESVVGRVQRQRRGWRAVPFDVHAEGVGLALAEGVERTGHLTRNAGAHDHGVHPSQHGAVHGRHGMELQLGQQVQAHRVVMAFTGQPDFDEGTQDGQPPGGVLTGQGRQGHAFVGLARGAAAFQEIVLNGLLGALLIREVSQGPAGVPFGVTVLQSAHDQVVDAGAGHHAQLPDTGHRLGQPPVGNGDAHAALDDARQRGGDGNRIVVCGGGYGHGKVLCEAWPVARAEKRKGQNGFPVSRMSASQRPNLNAVQSPACIGPGRQSAVTRPDIHSLGDS
ncbi:hypothetical protein ACFSC4_11135 [Deinococcus malanensis]|uniref:hypothetical protein n=1 Tax=Deinococcus malanensis TaxID=1706855 RepID=UPI00362E1ADB